MANKFVAVVLMCIVVVVAFSNPAASDCYNDCVTACNSHEEHKDDPTWCPFTCDSSCLEHPDPGRFSK